MSKEEFKKLILHRGKIDRYIFLLSFFVQNTFIKDVFRVLQEIDNTVYKYHYPMEINFLIYEELIDQKNKISIFLLAIRLIQILKIFTRFSHIA